MYSRSLCSNPKDVTEGMFYHTTDRSFRFKQVPQTEPLLRPITPSDVEDPPWIEKKESRPYTLVFLTTVFFFLVIALSFYIGRTWDSQFSTSSLLLSDITQYSPILEDIPLTYTLTQFNSSLLKPNIYRQDASPLVDTAWEALGFNYRSLILPPTLAAKSGFKQDQVKINGKYGGGYPANIEGLYHLHCLNLLRQSLYYNYEYYRAKGEGAFRNEDFVLKMHVSHCLDILREQLMCTVDVGVLGQVWIHPEFPEPYVDFNTQHKCRNFDDIRRWAEERQMPPADQVPEDWLEPPQEGDTIYEEMS